MKIEELAVRDVYLITPVRLPDERGHFYELFREDELYAATGHRLNVRQANYSVSRRNTLRGVHGVSTPDGQAKYVTCVRGALLDIVVDLRPGSPTYGRHTANRLEVEQATAVFMPEGMGHAFLALTDDACMSYLCSTVYAPGTTFEVNPLDPALGLPWPLTDAPIMSEKDLSAPSLVEAEAAGLLTSYAECCKLYRTPR
jgi:NDP-hexose 3,5-(Or5-) epimerase